MLDILQMQSIGWFIQKPESVHVCPDERPTSCAAIRRRTRWKALDSGEDRRAPRMPEAPAFPQFESLQTAAWPAEW